MKCTSCGGRLQGAMKYCPFCGVRQDIDLRQINFRDLGLDDSMQCPDCAASLDRLEFELQPVVQIERCLACKGLFFNPGEVELLLENHSHAVVWFDEAQIRQIADDFGHSGKVGYRKCPACADVMNRKNFGGRSGVIIDHCHAHGVWLEGGEFRRLAEWWRAGGRLIHQNHETKRAAVRFPVTEPRRVPAGTTESPASPVFPLDPLDATDGVLWILRVLASLLVSKR